MAATGVVDANASPADHGANEAAARAVVTHHAQLAAGLAERVDALVGLVGTDHLLKAEHARTDLVGFLRGEILPHARAEEQALYPAATALPAGRLLAQAMIDEHGRLTALVDELDRTRAPVVAAATGRALAALFAAHLAKENDLLLPLLLDAPEVSLAELLAGMHDLLGGAGHEDSAAGDETPAGSGAACRCGGCGCGGQAGSRHADSAAAPVLTMDSRLDVRQIPHSERHAVVLSAVEALAPGEAVVLVAPHPPGPVLTEIEARLPGRVTTWWLQSGPEVWQVRLHRTPVPQ
jgi:uncharacterized protein (DUF2249 family)